MFNKADSHSKIIFYDFIQFRPIGVVTYNFIIDKFTYKYIVLKFFSKKYQILGISSKYHYN